MKKRIALISAIMMAWAGLSMAANREFKPNEVIVKYKDNAKRTRTIMEDIYSVSNVVKVKRFLDFGAELENFEQLILEEGTDVNQAIGQLEKNPAVEYAQPNYILHALPVAEDSKPKDGIPCIPGYDIPGCTPVSMPCLVPGFPPGCDDGGGGGDDGNNPPADRPAVAPKPAEVNPPVADPSLSQSYGISKINAPKAWEKTKGNQEMIVAVIDTGVDYNHEDLSFNMWRNPNAADKKDIVGWDFVHNDNLPFDDHNHGTHCSGVIGAVGGNGIGISGVNQRVSIMALKFLSAQGSGDTAGAIKAIDYAIEHGAKVLSNSWGGGADPDNKALEDAILRAEKKDVLFIAAAGNDSSNNDTTPTYPASFQAPNLVAVAATDSNDRLASFSNYGAKTVHIAAPGVGIYSTFSQSKYGNMSGTSMACPHVAGAAALVWSKNPGMTYKQVKEKLLNSADHISTLSDKTITGGRLNVDAALN